MLFRSSFITSDNPRSEDPGKIIDAIVAGAHSGYRVQPDRAAAIRQAIKDASANDVVLIAGKGHENYQEVRGERVPFSDIEVARAVMMKRESAKQASKGGTRV